MVNRVVDSNRNPRALQARLALLTRVGLKRLDDCVLHFPLRYDDETRICPIASGNSNGPILVEGELIACEVSRRPRRQLVVTIRDGSAQATLRFFSFYPSQEKSFRPGVRVRAYGDLRDGYDGLEMIHPRCRLVATGMSLSETLTPVYPSAKRVTQALLKDSVDLAMRTCDLSDSLSKEIRNRWGLSGFEESVRLLHAPPPDIDSSSVADRTHVVWRRIKFDELLAQQLSIRTHMRKRASRVAVPLRGQGALGQSVLSAAGFGLTAAQHRVEMEIAADLARARPMQRLLQGDVGSGKTIVAALAAARALESGGQVVVMSPTEMLAEQTFRDFSGWLERHGFSVLLLSGNLPRTQRRNSIARISSGDARVVVGTHALLQEDVHFNNLVLAIVDEQHRFGVHQRVALRGKGTQVWSSPTRLVGSKMPEAHLLMLSATPIPRTLAISHYADLDISTIDELPPGRTPIATRLVADRRRNEVIQRVRDACMQGRQAYWVCPLIEESEALQLQTAVDTHAALCATFPELAVGLLHGRLKAAEKSATMSAFQCGELQLLVATTVIEVGVDVTNASLMVIEHAERMGLAQLHQLRGRVGRGSAKSTCILLYQTPLSTLARERLKVVYESTDGFEIARRDLELRGPGELMGARQSGLPMLRFADPVRDVDLLEAACEVAELLLDTDPEAVEKHLARWLPEAREWLNG
ncbi:MAG: ATP-dependent DNA helicase RecG [Proteobacteria bacterium]|nr:ATP-dependent DNA helicase RecG [Burkholderiales bacterium]